MSVFVCMYVCMYVCMCVCVYMYVCGLETGCPHRHINITLGHSSLWIRQTMAKRNITFATLKGLRNANIRTIPSITAISISTLNSHFYLKCSSKFTQYCKSELKCASYYYGVK